MYFYEDYTIGIIISIYKNTTISELDRALKSIDNQKGVKCVVYLGIDGPINLSLDKFINDLNLNSSILEIFKIKFETNNGLAKTHNHLFKLAIKNHKYIAKQDSDDYSSHERLLKQVKFLEENSDVHIVGSSMQIFDSNTGIFLYSINHPLNHKSIERRFCYSACISMATTLIRSNTFSKSGFYPTNTFLAEDVAFCSNAFLADCRFSNLSDILYYVGQTPEQLERRLNFKTIFDLFSLRTNYIRKTRGISFLFFYNLATLVLRILMKVLIILKLKKITKNLVKMYRFFSYSS